MPFHDQDVTSAVDRIKRLFSSTVCMKLKFDPNVGPGRTANEVFVTLRMKSGKRAKYEMPVISGETKMGEKSFPRPPLCAPRAGGFRSSTGGCR